jgi:hypothetical protein
MMENGLGNVWFLCPAYGFFFVVFKRVKDKVKDLKVKDA